MVDFTQLKKKFPAKKTGKDAISPSARAKAIAREYELKKAALTGGAPMIKRGPVFYGFLILILLVIGGFVTKGIMDGRFAWGKARIDRDTLNVNKAIRSLSIALGRYKFHVGEYPTAEEGLAVLAYRRPEELRKIRKAHPGWNGPYVNHIVKDPWGHDYVYEPPYEQGGHPVLYSRGPDGRIGTTDDVLPSQTAFDDAFNDTSWTNHWAPAEYRGYILAPDEPTRQRVLKEMKAFE